MKLYDVHLRLGGSLLHTVWERNCTAAEITVLARVHGNRDNDPIAEIKEIGSVKRTDEKERSRLRLKYLEWNLGRGEQLLREVLGPPSVPLPQTFVPPQVIAEEDDFDPEAPLDLEDEVFEKLEAPVEVLAPVRTRPVRRFPQAGMKRDEPNMSPPDQQPSVRA